MVAVRRRGDAEARSVRGQKERMTIAAETRELVPGGDRDRGGRKKENQEICQEICLSIERERKK